MSKDISVLLILAFSFKSLFSQDLHWSHWSQTQIDWNSSISLDSNVAGQLTVLNRSQWNAVSGVPFSSTQCMGALKIKGVHFGTIVSRDKAGDSNYLQHRLYGLVSFDVLKVNKIKWRSGLGLGLRQFSWNLDLLTWDNQWNGLYFNQNQNNSFALLNADHFLEYSFSTAFQYKRSKFLNVTLGVQNRRFSKDWMSNLMQVSGSNRLQVNKNLIFTQDFLLQIQGVQLEKLMAIGMIQLRDNRDWNKMGYTVQLGVRSKDAFLLNAGIIWKDMVFSMAYDVNSSYLRYATQGRGGWELYLSKYWWKRNNLKPIKLQCPEFY